MVRKITRHHLEHFYIITCMVILSFGVILFGFWSFYPYKTIEIDPNIILDKAVYRPGEHITYTMTYCKYSDKKVEVNRRLINGTTLNFTPKQGTLPIGCNTVKMSDLMIPEYADPDIYYIDGTSTYQINPIRKINVYWKSQQFKIVER